MDAPTPATLTLLLVETDSALAHATIIFLETLGHVVQHASNGREAIALVAACGVPDFILTDFHLSCSLNGVELIERLRFDAGWLIPAVIMTGDTSFLCRDTVDGLASCSLFSKPFDAELLTGALSGN